LSKNPRFVVFGSRNSGAYDAATAFEEYLATHGLEGAQVDAVMSRHTPPAEFIVKERTVEI
jgi:hypothetical protein